MNALETLLEDTLRGMGYELSDIEISNRNRILRIFIEKSLEGHETGITLDDCTRVSRQLQRVLPVEGVDFDRLEVSSPGLDRKLKKAADFQRFAGQEVEVQLRVLVNGRRRVTGVLRGIDGEQVALDSEGGQFVFELPNLKRARLVPKI
ncbi:MAG: ribosome maturation factor RimP [Betaproteobacteria bacterium]|nr:ribosome maturation factor RimP [Betaproteobacteria bacterium]